MPSIASDMRAIALFALGLALVASAPLAAETLDGAVDAADSTPVAPAASELVPPRVTKHVRALFPTSRRDRAEEAKELRMIVSVEVDVEGKPGHVEIVDTNLGTAYRRPALQAVSFWRFAPATRNGVPEATTVLVPVSFGSQGDGEQEGSGADMRTPGATNRVITAPRTTR